MDIFDSVEIIGHPIAHGEMNFFQIKPGANINFTDDPEIHADGAAIIGHSEQGHHHLLERAPDITVKKSAAVEMFHAIVKNPTRVYQDAINPHDAQMLEKGEYIIVPSRNFDPIAQQARRVMD